MRGVGIRSSLPHLLVLGILVRGTPPGSDTRSCARAVRALGPPHNCQGRVVNEGGAEFEGVQVAGDAGAARRVAIHLGW